MQKGPGPVRPELPDYKTWQMCTARPSRPAHISKPLPQRRISRTACQYLLRCNHPERPFHKGPIQMSEIENGSQTTILLGDEEVTAVEAWLALSWGNHFHGSFCQQTHHFGVQDMRVAVLNWCANHVAKLRRSLNELKCIISFYYPQNPVWHSGDGLPVLGPCDEGLNSFEQQSA